MAAGKKTCYSRASDISRNARRYDDYWHTD